MYLFWWTKTRLRCFWQCYLISIVTGRCDNTGTTLRRLQQLVLIIKNEVGVASGSNIGPMRTIVVTCRVSVEAGVRVRHWPCPVRQSGLCTSPTWSIWCGLRTGAGRRDQVNRFWPSERVVYGVSQYCNSVITPPCDPTVSTDEITLPEASQTSFCSPKQAAYPVDRYSTVNSAFKKINCYVERVCWLCSCRSNINFSWCY